MNSRVFFITVQTSGDKLKKILEICQKYFDNRQNLLIKTDSADASRFIDDLLWKFSPESFLPHSIGGKELLSIVHGDENPNGAISCFNLTRLPFTSSPFSKIYEFDDKTSVEKKKLSEEHFQAYKKSLIPITSY